MTKVALFGAGGKMGVRLSTNLAKTDFDVAHVEVSSAGRDRLKSELGFDTVDADAALAGAEVVILAVPDTVIRKVAASVVPQVAPGTMIVILDAAAPFAGHLPERADITYFVTHPCHPPIFNDEDTPEGRADHFGGVAAKQGVVNALWVVASLLMVMREAMDEVVARSGVSKECARDFLLGHMNILGAVIFEERQGQFSDACNKAIEFGIPMLMRDDWKKVLEWDEVAASIKRIT